MDDNQLMQLIEAIQEGHPNKQTAFERHSQTVIGLIVAAMIIGMASLLWQVKDNQGEIITRVALLVVAQDATTRELENQANPLPITRKEYSIHEHEMATRMFNVEKEHEGLERDHKARKEEIIALRLFIDNQIDEIELEFRTQKELQWKVIRQLEDKVENYHSDEVGGNGNGK